MTPLLTVQQAAARLSVSPALVYSLISGRKLRFVRVGNGRGRIRIPDEAIEEYLARATFRVEEKKPTPPQAPLKHLKVR